MNQVARWRTVVAVTLCVAACTGKPDAVCTPGASVACTCGAQAGAQACNADGTGYDSCQCTGGGSSSGVASSGQGSSVMGSSSGSSGMASGGGSSGVMSSSSAALSVAITAPANGAAVSGDLAVTVMVTGNPSTVSLLLDGSVTATLTAPYTHTLNTRPLSQGAHTLAARAVAGSQTLDSAVVNITVDNTAPTVISVVTHQRVESPVTIIFSEPIQDAALTATSLRLVAGTRDIPVNRTHPSPQVLVLTPTSHPVVPVSVRVEADLATIQDAAGNALAGNTNLGSVFQAAWALPLDRTPDTVPGLGGTVAVLPNGTVVTAEVNGVPGNAVVLRSVSPTDATFTSLPAPMAYASAVAYRVSVAAGADNSLWLAVLRDGTSNNRGVELFHQEAGNWVSLAFINGGTADLFSTWPLLQVAPDGAVVCGFVDVTPAGDTVRVLRRSATGTLFGDLLEWPLTNRYAGGFAMALDNAGNPAVAVTTLDMTLMAVVAQVNIHDGTNWVPAPVLQGIQPMEPDVSLAFSVATGWALAHTETDFLVGPNATLYVDQLMPGAWLPLGRAVDLDVRSTVSSPRLVGGPDLTLAFVETRLDPGPVARRGHTLVNRLDGTTWRGLAGAVDAPTPGGFLGYPVRDPLGFVWVPRISAPVPNTTATWQTDVSRTNVNAPQQGLPSLPASTPCAIPDPPPNLLSGTGCFATLSPVEPAAGVIPYTINSTLWSDAAEKNRWMVIPPGATINFTATGALDLPVGTILIKDFFIPTDPLTQPDTGKMAETRFLVKRAADIWDGYSYQWRDDGTDADLLPDLATTRDFVRANNTIHTHTYPSRVMCGRCHNEAAGFTLGLQAPQLHKNQDYGSQGQVSNELHTLEALGLFGTTPLPQTVAAIPSPWDARLPVETRVRAYLHANCAHCHRPGGEFSAMDMRFDTALADTRLCNLQRVIPGDVANSKLHLRLAADVNNGMPMPPLARREVDTQALQLVDKWITEMTSCP